MKYLKGLLVKFLIKYVADYAKGEKVIAIKEKIKGYKTILMSVASIIGAIIAWSTDTMNLSDAIQIIVTSILAMTIRAGISSGK